MSYLSSSPFEEFNQKIEEYFVYFDKHGKEKFYNFVEEQIKDTLNKINSSKNIIKNLSDFLKLKDVENLFIEEKLKEMIPQLLKNKNISYKDLSKNEKEEVKNIIKGFFEISEINGLNKEKLNILMKYKDNLSSINIILKDKEEIISSLYSKIKKMPFINTEYVEKLIQETLENDSSDKLTYESSLKLKYEEEK